MNLKLLTTTTLLLLTGAAIPVLGASDRDLVTLFKTRQCIDCNLSILNSVYKSNLMAKDLRNANFKGANLYGSSLKSSDLRNTNFSNTNARFTVFSGADLRNANFSYADLSNANFCNADLRGVNWEGAIFTKSTKCLPDEAISYIPQVKKENSDRSKNSCRGHASNSSSSKKSTRNDMDTVREATSVIRNVIKLF